MSRPEEGGDRPGHMGQGPGEAAELARLAQWAEVGRELSAGVEAADQPDNQAAYQSVADKLLIARGMTVDEYGDDNLRATLEWMYFSVFHPDLLDDEELADPRFEDRLQKLTSRVPSLVDQAGAELSDPGMDQFVTDGTEAITRRARYDRALYPGALEAIEDLALTGYEIDIWTAGDFGGIPGKLEEAPGSRMQFFIVARALTHPDEGQDSSGIGINRFRRRLAQRAAEQSGVRGMEPVVRKPADIVKASIGERKVQRLEGLFERAREGRHQPLVVVADDQLHYLEDAKRQFEQGNFAHRQPPLRLETLWVRQGRNKNKLPPGTDRTIDDWAADYEPRTVSSIVEVAAKVGELAGDNEPKDVVVLLDFDGVLMRDKEREKEKARAIFNLIDERYKGQPAA